jgi:heme-degrading monooxygenase HmoA
MNRKNFKAPYYAVLFSYQRGKDLEGYMDMDEKTLELAKGMPGYLGHEFAGDGAVHAIFISYWKDMESIENWKRNSTHKKAKSKAKTQWYQWYHSQISKVEHSAYNEL